MSRRGGPEQDLMPVSKNAPRTDLGLTPVFDDQREDLGLNSQDIQAASRVLAAFLRLNMRPIIPTLIGEIIPDLEQQLGFAERREETQVAISEVAQQGRRKFLMALLSGLTTVAAIGGVGSLVGLYYRDEPRRKQEFEQNHTLGIKPTAPSSSNWIVYYEPKEEGVDFIRSTDPNPLVVLPPDRYIQFIELGSTNIFISDYTRSDGMLIPKLTIRLAGNVPTEEWILRDHSAPDIEPRVVVFEHVTDGTRKYLYISRNNSVGASYQLELKQKIKR